MKCFFAALTLVLLMTSMICAQEAPTAPSSPQTPAQESSAQKESAQKESAQKESAQTKTATQTAAEKSAAAKPVVTNPAATKTKQQSKPNSKKALELTFDDIKFEMEKDSKFSRTMLTPEIRKYHNSNITIRGYIQPNSKQSGLKKFVFVRDNKECCFGPGAALYDCMLVQLTKGKTTEYTTRPITITGKFFVKEYRIAGKVWAIYRMSNTEVK